MKHGHEEHTHGTAEVDYFAQRLIVNDIQRIPDVTVNGPDPIVEASEQLAVLRRDIRVVIHVDNTCVRNYGAGHLMDIQARGDPSSDINVLVNAIPGEVVDHAH
jgi:hypothetical protein